MTDRTELEEAVYWSGREIQEARAALWDGKCGEAFANIEAAMEQMQQVEELLEERDEIDL